jgi:hypothetical protein
MEIGSGKIIHLDEDGEPIKECCYLAKPYTCGDCFGGTENDPYVNGSASGWTRQNADYYDGGRLIRHEI